MLRIAMSSLMPRRLARHACNRFSVRILSRRKVMANDGVVSAWVFRPRRPKLIEKDSAAIRRLVEIDARTADRTASVRIDVARIGNERELEELAVFCRTNRRETAMPATGIAATATAARTRWVNGNRAEPSWKNSISSPQ
jgi:mRNA degradation ribonuclease J1/J2